MASNVLKYVLIGGGAYLLWQSGALSNILSSFGVGAPAAAPPPAPPASGTPTVTGGGSSTSTGGAGSSTPPSYQYTAPSTRQALLAAIAKDNNTFYAQQGQKFSADQWKYYYDRLPGDAGKLDAVGFDSIFFPSGRPSDPTQYPLFDVDAFLSAIATKGLSGLGSSSLAAIMPTPIASLVQRAASGDLVAAVHLTRMGVKFPIGGRNVTPAAMLAHGARAGMRGIHLGGLPVSALKV